MKLAERIQHVELSPTFRINALARRMKAQGIDVLDFSVGEPDFETPRCAKEAGKSAIDRNVTRYTANEGTLELRQAIVDKLKADNDLTYATDQVLVSPGAKASLYCAAMALFGPGDEVLVPQPYWVSYPEQIRLAGATPVPLVAQERNGFKITPKEIEAARGPNTRGLILNYPSNPTGACYDRRELAAIAEVAVKRNLVVVADEIYEKLLYCCTGVIPNPNRASSRLRKSMIIRITDSPQLMVAAPRRSIAWERGPMFNASTFWRSIPHFLPGSGSAGDCVAAAS